MANKNPIVEKSVSRVTCQKLVDEDFFTNFVVYLASIMEKEYKKSYFLIPGEANAQQEMPLTLLATKIIEIATEHANTLNIGHASMVDKNLGWVLSRLTVEMRHWPKVNEHYTIITWIESWNKHFSERNFEIQNAQGETIGYARTVWMVINTVTHENAGTTELCLQDGLISDRECPIAKQAKLKIVECDNPVNYTFTYTDIDFYRHVNTVKYIALLVNQFTMDDSDRCSLSRFEIAFMSEGKYGDQVQVMRQTVDGVSSFAIRHGERPLIRARFALRPR